MRIASIDIGTNSTRLLIADKMESGLNIINSKMKITRIGEKIGPEKVLKPEPMKRTLDCLLEYKDICNNLGVDRVTLAATSAVRDAVNKNEFIELVRQKTNWILKVLTGDQEALLSYTGVIKGLKGELTKPLVIDIGGGSTEFIWKPSTVKTISLNAGAVRMTEGGYTEEEIKRILRPAIDGILEYKPLSLIGVGGTVTTCAAIDQELTIYDPDKVHGYKMVTQRVRDILVKLQSLDLEKRKKVRGLQPERADIIIAGATILKIILEELRVSEIMVSETDILYGLIYQEVSES